MLRSGIELALQVLDEQREPADAIVRAWLGLQETAEESGIVRQPAETPTEFTVADPERAPSPTTGRLRTLLRLYLRTRFGDHPVTGEDVAAVRAALQELVRTWPDAGSSPDAGLAETPRAMTVTARIRWSTLLRPPERRATIRVLLVALLTAAICWYFGADVWHSILIGSVVTTLGLIGSGRHDIEARRHRLAKRGPTNRRGSRR